MNARELIKSIRESLEPINREIIDHGFIRMIEKGELGIDSAKSFVVNQWYIVNYDLRSIAIALSRTRDINELNLLKRLLDGDYLALMELRKLMRELGLVEEDPVTLNINPIAVSYTHYIAWLARYATIGEFVLALIINLPIWGHAVYRLGTALKRIGLRELGFFDAFRGPFTELEDEAAKVIEPYINESTIPRMKNIASLIQSYEKAFWDSLIRVK